MRLDGSCEKVAIFELLEAGSHVDEVSQSALSVTIRRHTVELVTSCSKVVTRTELICYDADIVGRTCLFLTDSLDLFRPLVSH